MDCEKEERDLEADRLSRLVSKVTKQEMCNARHWLLHLY